MNSLALAIGAITTVPAAGTLFQNSFAHSAEWIAVATVFAIAAGAIHELRRDNKVVTHNSGLPSVIRSAARVEPLPVHVPGRTRHRHHDAGLESNN